MAATRVDGTGTNKRLPYLLYEVITNNATTYTLRLSLGVNNKNSTDYYATTESYISKKIGSGAASFVYASSSVRVRSGDTIIISNTTWTITKTHASQSISVGGVPYLDHAPVGSVVKALTVPARTSYAVTFNANSGSGAPAQQTKWYGETLTLSSAKPTKDGYTFKGWATSEANAKIGTVGYASGATVEANTNSALNLWAVWELTYSKPTITNLHIERCDASGTADDEGTLALVSFDWSVFRSSAPRYYNGSTTPYTSTTVQSCSVTIGSETATPTLTGASGSASVVVGSAGSFLTDTQYNASVTITDTVDSAIQPSHSSTATGALSTTFFPMDFNADASALGFFRPAPDSGDGVYFGKSIDVTGTLTLNSKVMNAFVTEYGNAQGGTGNAWWTYRKWSNGMEEAWGVVSCGSLAGSAWANNMYYTDQTVDFPSGIFSGAPAEVFITGGNAQWLPVGTSVNTTTGFTFRAMKPVSTARSLIMRVYAVKYPTA